jgi:hypothetical protein
MTPESGMHHSKNEISIKMNEDLTKTSDSLIHQIFLVVVN